MKLYTKTGDKGKTGLFGGQRVPKDNARIETYGTIDELNSILGIVRHYTKQEDLDNIYYRIQNELFDLGSDLATPFGSKYEDKVYRMCEKEVLKLEEEIDSLQSESPEFTNFILPGGGPAGSFLHQARTVCRRAERLCVTLQNNEDIGVWPQKYLNRLSDFFFIASRYANVKDGYKDVEWNKKLS
jgi:cob(I)alamin adenosyltransferase